MLYHIFYPLSSTYTIFNVFKYITFRTAYAILTALLISFICGPFVIKTLEKYQLKRGIRDDVPQRHLEKANTPTMGGVLIFIAILIPSLLWADLTSKFVWAALFVTSGFALIGLLDDYLKIKQNGHGGLSARHKFLLQILVGTAFIGYLCTQNAEPYMTRVAFPFFKGFAPDLGLFYIPFAVFVIVGTSNAVNLTDGLDGLAIGPIMIASATYMLISYLTGHAVFANYLMIFNVQGAGELTVFCGAIVGAALGFLWFNAYPAQVFMGDMGSLALGSALAAVAVMTKHELILPVVGGVFAIETLSVLIQVISFKARGKRVFRMAPIHHHFELKGWVEPKIIVRFWIISIILALFSLSTLKLR